MSALAHCLAVILAAAGAPAVHSDYYEAYRAAEQGRQMLMVDIGSGFDFGSLNPQAAAGHVFCRVPADQMVEVNGQPQRLLSSPSFATLEGRPGIVVIDLRPGPTHGKTVSALPQRYVHPGYVQALLALPSGTLTQRTLIWAFRVHGERPQSVYGQASPDLMSHCERHSQHQASTNRMFHASGFPGSSEIVAQSWSWNQNVVDAAMDVVKSWRQSPAHWSSANRMWSSYGYDMKRSGDKWFATGVFR